MGVGYNNDTDTEKTTIRQERTMKILIIEDDKIQNNVLAGFLRKEGYEAFSAYTLTEANPILNTEDIKLILLDLMLPDGNGLDFLKDLRRTNDVPVIVLTSLSGEITQLQVFDLQADDYVDKPASPEIISRRIKSLFNRVYGKDEIIPIRGYYFDFGKFVVTDEVGNLMPLTTTEIKIIKMFYDRKEHALPREKVIEIIWGFEYKDDIRILDPHIKNIRKKLSSDFIITVKNVGYRLNL